MIDRFFGKAVLLVPCSSIRGQLFIGKFAAHFMDHPMFFRKGRMGCIRAKCSSEDATRNNGPGCQHDDQCGTVINCITMLCYFAFFTRALVALEFVMEVSSVRRARSTSIRPVFFVVTAVAGVNDVSPWNENSGINIDDLLDSGWSISFWYPTTHQGSIRLLVGLCDV